MSPHKPRTYSTPGAPPPSIYRAFYKHIADVPPKPRITPQALLELLLVKCTGGVLDAKAACLTIAGAFRAGMELSPQQRVNDNSDAAKFFEEMASRLAEAPSPADSPTARESRESLPPTARKSKLIR